MALHNTIAAALYTRAKENEWADNVNGLSEACVEMHNNMDKTYEELLELAADHVIDAVVDAIKCSGFLNSMSEEILKTPRKDR